jgi:hypothetical protein
VTTTNGAGPHLNGRSLDDEDFQVGDLVVLMAEPGPFTVVEVEGPLVTVQSGATRRKVRNVALRKVSGEPPLAR